MEEERSLAETPTYAVATVVCFMVSLGFFFNGCLEKAGEWLDRTKRKSLLAALEKIKEELMLFGLLSLLMGHWIEFVAKICVKSSALSSRFYPCARQADFEFSENTIFQTLVNPNSSVPSEQMSKVLHRYCPEGQESFASHESLEQLHRFLFVLAAIHISYSFATIALAMIKIYSWKVWENQAKTMANQGGQGSPKGTSKNVKMVRLSTFIFHHTSHPWSQNRVLVWLLCFGRQWWSSINRPDYMALRLGFLTTHELPLSYDFHSYMLRSMEEEFKDIVGIRYTSNRISKRRRMDHEGCQLHRINIGTIVMIFVSVPLWVYAIACIFLDFHGTNIYFFISFLPAILILLIGTKLHRIVVKLAVEIMDSQPVTGTHQFKLRDDLFWFGKPRLVLWLIQFISFLNAFEMAMFIWSLWEIRETSCFMDNKILLVIRLVFGVVSQFWCSYITFPLYVIVTQMGSKFKKSLIPENVRRSLHGWHTRSKRKQGGSTPLVSPVSVTSLDSSVDGTDESNKPATINKETGYFTLEYYLVSNEQAGIPENHIHKEESIQMPSYANEILEVPEQHPRPIFDKYTSNEDTNTDGFDDVINDLNNPMPGAPLHGHGN